MTRTFTGFIHKQWFTVMILVLLTLAWIWPRGAGVLNPGGWGERILIVSIFFLAGLTLPSEEVLHGARHWRLHAAIQLFGFALTPLLTWLALLPARASLPEGLLIGIYLLSVLPTTITSCVVLTQISGGNVTGALFNAVLGNFLGVVLSPMLLLLLMGVGATTVELDAVGIFLKLGAMVLLPFGLGQVAHWLSRGALGGWRRRALTFNAWAILMIIYFAFCKTFAGSQLTGQGFSIWLPLFLLVPAHLGLLGIARAMAAMLKFNSRDTIAILFTAPQKTLALGLPLTLAILAERPDLVGLASLPIIIYHPLQLIVAGFMKDRFAMKAATDNSP